MKRAHIQKVKFIAVLTILSLHGLSCTWALSIHRAAMNGRVDQITKRMEKGDKVNAYDNYGWTPLMWAVYYNQLNAVRYLISQGADVNYASKDIYSSFPKKTTPLMLCATYDYRVLANILIEAGAKVESKDTMGNTAITYAELNNLLEMVKLLNDTNKRKAK